MLPLEESGAAIGIFLAVYMFFIWQIGKAQNTVFWQNLVESSRLDAIIQSIPGSLAWYNSDLKYIGYNPKHKALWKFTDDQTGQSLLQNGLGESLKSLVGDVFKSESEVRTIQKIDKQTYYLIGKQYSYGGEALLMGIDVSSQHTVQNELERSRNTIVHSSRYLEIGEIFRVLLKNGVPFDYLDSLLGSLTMGKDADAQKISSMEIVSEINRLFGKACENLKIELKFSQQESFTAHMQKSEIILALSSLLLNSLDILKSVENPEILVSTKVDGGTGIFAIRDNGPEVDEVFRDIIFEPFFSTDDAHSGMGLSLVKEIAHNHKGELTLKEGKEFQIRVPVQHS